MPSKTTAETLMVCIESFVRQVEANPVGLVARKGDVLRGDHEAVRGAPEFFVEHGSLDDREIDAERQRRGFVGRQG
jgi:hypothetical protein